MATTLIIRKSSNAKAERSTISIRPRLHAFNSLFNFEHSRSFSGLHISVSIQTKCLLSHVSKWPFKPADWFISTKDKSGGYDIKSSAMQHAINAEAASYCEALAEQVALQSCINQAASTGRKSVRI